MRQRAARKDLSQFIAIAATTLRSRFPGYQLNLYMHSQGNAIVSEAIRNGAPFDTYILTEGALPDSAYDKGGAVNRGIYTPICALPASKAISCTSPT